MSAAARGTDLCAVSEAASRGEILLFSDANTEYSPDAVRLMVRHFADSAAGCASGRKIVLNAAALYGLARYFLLGQSPLWRRAEQ